MDVLADLRARQVTTSVAVGAPQEGRAKTRVNWILRQLSEAAPTLRITSAFASTRETSSVLVSEARDDVSKLFSVTDPRRDIRSFEIALTRPLGLKNGKGKGSLVADTTQQVLDFYGDVVQNLAPWHARALRLSESWEEQGLTGPQGELQAPNSDDREIEEEPPPTDPPAPTAPVRPSWDQHGSGETTSSV